MRAGSDRSTTQLVAPMAGTVVDLTEVPDPVFSSSDVGRGLAIYPDEVAEHDGGPTSRMIVAAPCAGRLTGVYPHALMVRLDPERAVLIHLGLDTAQLDGAGFSLAACEGQRVEAGQALVAWSPREIRLGGRSTLSPVIALQAHAGDVLTLVAPGDRVVEGQPLLLWS